MQTPLAGKRCLVLDDEFLIAMDIQQILEAAGATVTCAASVTKALAALKSEEKFDVAVLDVKLSDAAARTSIGLATLLAQQGVPFVFLTGLSRVDMHAMPFPNAPVIEKPYQAPELVDAVLRALSASGRGI